MQERIINISVGEFDGGFAMDWNRSKERREERRKMRESLLCRRKRRKRRRKQKVAVTQV